MAGGRALRDAGGRMMSDEKFQIVQERVARILYDAFSFSPTEELAPWREPYPWMETAQRVMKEVLAEEDK